MKPIDQVYERNASTNPDNVPGDCVRACVASILDMPLDDVPHFVLLAGEDWAEMMQEWCERNGIVAEWYHDDIQQLEPYMLTGPSPRQGRHAVVYKSGKLLHDPHSSRAGLGSRELPGLNYFISWTFTKEPLK